MEKEPVQEIKTSYGGVEAVGRGVGEEVRKRWPGGEYKRSVRGAMQSNRLTRVA
jgi:hypothetical protein